MRGLSTTMSSEIPWMGRGRRDGAPRVHQLLETFLPQQLAVDDARRPELDDGVAPCGIEARGFRIENGVGQLGQKPVVQSAALFGHLEQVEVVVLGSAEVALAQRRIHHALHAGQGQHETEEGLVPGALTLEPHLAAMALDHIPHGQRAALTAEAHGVHFPAHHGLVAHGLAAPDQVQLGMCPTACRRSCRKRTSNSSTSRWAR